MSPKKKISPPSISSFNNREIQNNATVQVYRVTMANESEEEEEESEEEEEQREEEEQSACATAVWVKSIQVPSPGRERGTRHDDDDESIGVPIHCSTPCPSMVQEEFHSIRSGFTEWTKEGNKKEIEIEEGGNSTIKVVNGGDRDEDKNRDKGDNKKDKTTETKYRSER